MKPSSCKAKGRRLQQAIADELLANFPQLQADDIRSNPMGAHGEDILLSPHARTIIPYSFECKNQERLNVWASIDQAITNTPSNAQPAVVIKRNNSQPFVVIPWSCFLGALRERVTTNPSATESSTDVTTTKDELMRISESLKRIASTIEA